MPSEISNFTVIDHECGPELETPPGVPTEIKEGTSTACSLGSKSATRNEAGVGARHGRPCSGLFTHGCILVEQLYGNHGAVADTAYPSLATRFHGVYRNMMGGSGIPELGIQFDVTTHMKL